jgi:hypothetical protein
MGLLVKWPTIGDERPANFVIGIFFVIELFTSVMIMMCMYEEKFGAGNVSMRARYVCGSFLRVFCQKWFVRFSFDHTRNIDWLQIHTSTTNTTN